MMSIGSRMIFRPVEKSRIIIGVLASPAPWRIELTDMEKLNPITPMNMMRMYFTPKTRTSPSAPSSSSICGARNVPKKATRTDRPRAMVRLANAVSAALSISREPTNRAMSARVAVPRPMMNVIITNITMPLMPTAATACALSFPTK